jgi:tetratricopeptide (TPR) repeat protein
MGMSHAPIIRSIALGCLSFFLFASAAQAKWLEASSDHFVIYGDQHEEALKGFAERLERFHATMIYVFGKQPTKPSPSNRVTIFVVSSASKVREVTGTKNRYLAGIYIPRAGGSVAVIPKLKSASSDFELSGETILYHEYAHHFMMGLTDRAYPRWFVEGFAEFSAGVKFQRDGSIALGTAPTHRALELFYGREVPIRRLLDFDGGAAGSKGYDSFYGQSWVLFHYLQLDPARAGQLQKYEMLLAKGQSALEAAEGAFGDLDQLEKETESYIRRSRLSAIIVKPTRLTISPVALRQLRPGEAAMMPIRVESRVGVTLEEARSLVPEARKIAARYPEDPVVLAALAEAELDAGNDDAAIAAADRALAIDPQQINAHLQKGYALSHKAITGKLPKEFWKEVRGQFAKANRIENDHPIPLVQFYLSYLAQGERPTENSIDGLEWAMQLAPFDMSLRWLVAQQMVSDKRLPEAAQILAPLAYSPHPGEHTDKARQLLKDVEAQLKEPQASAQ